MTIDLRNQDTEEDFHALTRGLFIAAKENGYLPLWRRMVKHKAWGSKVKHYVHVTGKARIAVTNTGITGGLRTMLDSLAGRKEGAGELGHGRVYLVKEFDVVVELEPKHVGHSEEVSDCTTDGHISRYVNSVLSERMRQHIDTYEVVSVQVEHGLGNEMRMVCSHPLCTKD